MKHFFTSAKVAILASSILMGTTSCSDKTENNNNTIADNTKEIQKPKGKLFKMLPKEKTGIAFGNHFTLETSTLFYKYQYLFNGGGIAVADFNNDGQQDLFFTGSEVTNKMYLNKGNLTFEDVTEAAGVADADGWSAGVVVVDINSDNLPDLYISKAGYVDEDQRENVLFVNQGDGTFKDEAKAYGIAENGYSTQSMFFDYDLDGDLDLYILNHGNEWESNAYLEKKKDFRPLQADKLYRNEGNGKFTDVSETSGLNYEEFGGWGLGVAQGDLNQDGYPDLYISNDYDSPDYVYINQGNGKFKDMTKAYTKHVSLYSMGNDIADFNNDGLVDIVSLDMSAEDNERTKTQMSAMAPDKFYELVNFGLPHQYMYNSMQMNNGNETFSDIGFMAGIQSTDWSWAPLLADFDNDGWKDLFVSNGYRLDDRDNDYTRRAMKIFGTRKPQDQETAIRMINETPSTPLPNYIFQNNGNLTFTKKTYEWGIGQKGFSQGSVFVDLDNDGDLELVTNNINDDAWLYENLGHQNNHINVSLKGPNGNTQGIGATVTLKTEDNMQFHYHSVSRGYMSSVSPLAHFGIGDKQSVSSVEVKWPDGKMEVVKDVKANTNLTFDYKNAQMRNEEAPTAPLVFASVDEEEMGLTFKHTENPFDDFKAESLLPHRNSQHGPGVAVGDANGDGLEDVYICGPVDQESQLFFQQPNGKFKATYNQPWARHKVAEDMNAEWLDVDGDGDLDLYVVAGGYEYIPNSPEYIDRVYINDGKGKFSYAPEWMPGNVRTSGQIIEPFDIDGDGDLDLFIGGRVVPGQYPLAPRSYVLENTGSTFKDITKKYAPGLMNPGLVTGAEWADVDNDGKTDLLVSGEWMPIQYFKNTGSSLEEVKVPGVFGDQVGWWRNITSGDFDNDGDIDFAVGNLGTNYKYKASEKAPFHIYCYDFDNTGTLDIVLGYYEKGTCYPLRGRQCSSEQMPFIKKKFPTYNDFANASLKDVYGDKLEKATHYAANNFSSVYIENLGNGKFEMRPLPQRLQISIINDMLSADFDGDGHLDILAAGNLFTAEVETPRSDAGIGLYLKGDGKGNFKSIPVNRSGFFTPGDVKDLEFLKMADGSVLIIAANNNDHVTLHKVLSKSLALAVK